MSTFYILKRCAHTYLYEHFFHILTMCTFHIYTLEMCTYIWAHFAHTLLMCTNLWAHFTYTVLYFLDKYILHTYLAATSKFWEIYLQQISRHFYTLTTYIHTQDTYTHNILLLHRYTVNVHCCNKIQYSVKSSANRKSSSSSLFHSDNVQYMYIILMYKHLSYDKHVQYIYFS